MNVCIVRGKLQQRPVLLGDGKVMKFNVVTRYRQDVAEDKDGFATVPCVVFNPSESLKQLLANDDAKSVKAVGRVNRSRYEDKEGKTVYSTEVILNPETVMVRAGS